MKFSTLSVMGIGYQSPAMHGLRECLNDLDISNITIPIFMKSEVILLSILSTTTTDVQLAS